MSGRRYSNSIVLVVFEGRNTMSYNHEGRLRVNGEWQEAIKSSGEE